MSSVMDSPSKSRTSSAFLQGMIQEKRSQTQRTSRPRDGTSSLISSARETQSSPIAPQRERPAMGSRRSSNMTGKGPSAPKEMGLREMQEYISKIDKQNFDLKLDIFHRRRRCDDLETQVSKLPVLEAENEDLRAQNADLVFQVEKADADIETRELAIEEAVGMICELEARIGDLEQDLEKYRLVVDAEVAPPPPPPHINLQSKTPTPDDDLSTPSDAQPLRKEPETTLKKMASYHSSPRSPLRPPSFLQDDKKSHTALRSLYSSGKPSIDSFQRPSSVFSNEELEEELDRQMMSSPRLSILSESGFSSIYGHKAEETVLEEAQSNSLTLSSDSEGRAAQRKARISDWVEQSQAQQQEPPKTPRRQPSQLTNPRFSSINAVLEKPSTLPLQEGAASSPKSRQSITSSDKDGAEKASQNSRSPTKSLRKSARAHEKLSAPASMTMFPPTPDTMSTATIGANSSTQSIVTERSLAEGKFSPGYPPLATQERPLSSDSQQPIQRQVSNQSERQSLRPVDDGRSTSVQQGELSQNQEPNYPYGSVKASRFFGVEPPRRPALNTHVSDMMFNGEGFSPKHASKEVSFVRSAHQDSLRQRQSRSYQDSNAPTHRSTPTSPVKVRPPTQESHRPPDRQALPEASSPRKSTALRFRLPTKHSSASNPASSSVTSRIFKRNKAQAPADPTNADSPTRTDVPAPTSPPARPRLVRPSSVHGATHLRPGTADGGPPPQRRTSGDVAGSGSGGGRKWMIGMRRHSAVLDDSHLDLPGSVPSSSAHHREFGLKDPDTGLKRVSQVRNTGGVESTTTGGGGGGNLEDVSRFRSLGGRAGARLRDGFGLARR